MEQSRSGKLTGFQLVEKFPAFYGTRRFITTFTRVQHLSVNGASLIQSMPPHPTSCRSTLILYSHLCLDLPSGLFPFHISIYTQNCVCYLGSVGGSFVAPTFLQTVQKIVEGLLLAPYWCGLCHHYSGW